MKLYYVQYENDIGLNLNGRIGCYSSKEKMDEVLEYVKNSGYFEGSIEDEINEGLLIIKEIEG